VAKAVTALLSLLLMVICQELKWSITRSYPEIYSDFFIDQIRENSSFKLLVNLRIINNICTGLLVVFATWLNYVERNFKESFELRDAFSNSNSLFYLSVSTTYSRVLHYLQSVFRLETFSLLIVTPFSWEEKALSDCRQ